MLESPNSIEKIEKPRADRIEDDIFLYERRTVIRESKLSTVECAADFVVPTTMGIRVYSDSEKLAKETEQAFGVSNKYAVPTVDFVYLTKSNIKPIIRTEKPTRPIEVGILGDLVVDTTLTQYALSGPDKFGSLESVLFGIRSFEQIEKGLLGLHAAQIFDNKYNKNHVFIGGSGTGKSTLVQFLEMSDPGRYTVIADDWVEIDTKHGVVQPVSTTFGSRTDTLTSGLILDNGRAEGKFTSFGKDFFMKDQKQNPHNSLGLIVMLEKPNQSNLGHREQDWDLFVESNRHIPFITQYRELDNLPQMVQKRLTNLYSLYQELRSNKNYTLIQYDNGADISKSVEGVLELLKNL